MLGSSGTLEVTALGLLMLHERTAEFPVAVCLCVAGKCVLCIGRPGYSASACPSAALKVPSDRTLRLWLAV